MICLYCNTRNHAEDMSCLSCGKPLNKEPFTPEQRMWHIFNAFVPLVGVGIFLFAIRTFNGMASSFGSESGFGTGSIIWWLFIAIFAAVIGISLYQNGMDLLGGVTRSHTAKLNRKYRSGGRRGSRKFYAEFEQIGKVNLMLGKFQELEEGTVYKVTYSPNTKRGWEFERQP